MKYTMTVSVTEGVDNSPKRRSSYITFARGSTLFSRSILAILYSCAENPLLTFVRDINRYTAITGNHRTSAKNAPMALVHCKYTRPTQKSGLLSGQRISFPLRVVARIVTYDRLVVRYLFYLLIYFIFLWPTTIDINRRLSTINERK